MKNKPAAPKTMAIPGPWSVQPIGDESECNILGPGRELIATVSDNEANLIAAAPEYYRISRDIVAEIDLALGPGSRDTFMTLVSRIQRWRGALRQTISRSTGEGA